MPQPKARPNPALSLRPKNVWSSWLSAKSEQLARAEAAHQKAFPGTSFFAGAATALTAVVMGAVLLVPTPFLPSASTQQKVVGAGLLAIGIWGTRRHLQDFNNS